MMNKHLYLSILFCISYILPQIGICQTTPYFQQEVNYDITVTLNDVNSLLEGSIEIEYTNNSNDELSFIYFHLWPNAYLNSKSAFGQQKIEANSSKFYFSDEQSRGKIYGLEFAVNGKSATHELDSENSDIAILNLPKPLKPNASITIRTPFIVKIPKSYSRLGRVGQSYQLTQWYPKPAVYDHKGWHPMPYLDQGEFYSEFGTFNVSITLPKNYVVGATGQLQTKSEIKFLENKVRETKAINFEGVNQKAAFPDSEEETKTIQYLAENVHDFAWFADKRFHVLKDQVTLNSGKTVDTWVMFTDQEANLWKDAIEYVNRSVKFYSEEVGEYPYPHATAVQSALSAGAGMEYPMITVIGKSGDAHGLDIVITHEVGHNWFYGILASDERTHPWMDEGMNSYYEARYNRKYYNQQDELDYVLPAWLVKMLNAEGRELGQFAYQYYARQNMAQPIETPSQDLTSANYFLSGYMRPAGALAYLEAYIGTPTMDKLMQTYYNEWKFKHPYPEDFREVAERVSGKDLTWFFDDVLGQKGEQPIDYQLKKSGGKLKVTNLGEVAGPYSISTLKDGEIVDTQWYEGTATVKELPMPAGDYDEIQLDAIKVIPEVNRKNNGQKRSIKLNLLSSLENPKQSVIHYLPLLGYNHYDGFMAGLSLHNKNIPGNKFEYHLAPMFGFKSSDVAGMADFALNSFPRKGFLQQATVGLGLKSFHYAENGLFDYDDKYYRITPRVELKLKRPTARSKTQQSISLKVPVVILSDGTVARDSIGVDSTGQPQFSDTYYNGQETTINYYPKLTYTLSGKQGLNPFSFQPSIEFHKFSTPFRDVLRFKAELEAKYSYMYQRGRKVSFRLYAAGAGDNRAVKSLNGPFAINLISGVDSDYSYDDYFFHRSPVTAEGSNVPQYPISGNQINSNRGGGFHNPGITNQGQSASFAMAVNLKADLPFKGINLPFKPYADLGYSLGPDQEGDFLGTFGIAIEFLDAVGIYLPLVQTEDFKFRGGYLNRVGFQIDLHRLNVLNYRRGLSF